MSKYSTLSSALPFFRSSRAFSAASFSAASFSAASAAIPPRAASALSSGASVVFEPEAALRSARAPWLPWQSLQVGAERSSRSMSAAWCTL